MRENSFEHWRILAAALAATALIVGAYVIARGVESPSVAQASTETALLEKISSKDSDSDGLRDWEEALFGTDPKVADTRKLGMTDGEAVAKGLIVPQAIAAISAATSSPATIPGSSLPVPREGTITRALGESFITAYAAAVQNSPDGTLSTSDIQKLSNDIVSQLESSIIRAPDFKSMNSLKVTGSGAAALKSFAAAADAVFLANRGNATTSELTYLDSLLNNNDQTAIPHLLSIAKVYQDTAAGLAVIPVPTEVASDNLMLINAMSRLSKIIEDFTRTDSDPVATMLALKQYPDEAKKLGTAFIHINGAFKTAGVTFSANEPGVNFVNLIETVLAQQKSEASKP